MLCRHLDNNFEDPKALFLLGFVFIKTDSIGLAYQVLKRAAEIFPGEAAIWHNIGKCFHEKQDDEKADYFFRHALKVKPDFANSLEGLGLTHLNRSEYDEAIHYCNRCLAEDPDAREARVNRGMAYLAMNRWQEGWRDYNVNVGLQKDRTEIIYGDEVRWDGSKGKDIVVYGEQGIGDEISFASCLPDLIRDSKSVTIECDGRLENLFKRSFPTCEVHGTRYKQTVPAWRSERKYDARVSIGSLPGFYRNKDSDFPGTPYLVPNPVMAAQWRTTLDSLGKRPKIGISWTGGIPKTGKRKRSVTLDTLAPLFRFDADFVSLQYTGNADIEAAEETHGCKIHSWEWGTMVYDYDQTVALISQLDLVISVCTTVVHAAGGLGIPTWCLVPDQVMWRYGPDKFHWANSVKLYRQKGKEWPIHLLLGQLKDTFGGSADSSGSGHRAGAESEKAAA